MRSRVQEFVRARGQFGHSARSRPSPAGHSPQKKNDLNLSSTAIFSWSEESSRTAGVDFSNSLLWLAISLISRFEFPIIHVRAASSPESGGLRPILRAQAAAVATIDRENSLLSTPVSAPRFWRRGNREILRGDCGPSGAGLSGKFANVLLRAAKAQCDRPKLRTICQCSATSQNCSDDWLANACQRQGCKRQCEQGSAAPSFFFMDRHSV